MRALLEVLLLNAAVATLLAALAAPLAWRLRRPALSHVLWLVVLVKLLTPPLLSVGAIPLPSTSSAAPAAVMPAGPVATAATVAPTTRWSPDRVVGAIWLVGVLGLTFVAAARVARFRRRLDGAVDAGPALRFRLESVAARLGLRSVPRLRLVPGRVSPMLWHGPGGSEILLPSTLLPRLAAEETDALLAHELAHVRRKDHWVRWIESAAVALFWWHPLVWWVRARLRVAEEQSCDVLVLRALPRSAAAYAESLLKTVEFLAGRRSASPLLSTGAGETRRLNERLTMILDSRRFPPVTVLQRWLVGIAAALALLIFPTWAEPRESAPPAADERDSELDALRHETLELELRMRELAVRRAELGREMRREKTAQQVAELQQEQARLREQGLVEEAEAAERLQAELVAEQNRAERRAELDQQAMAQLAMAQDELREAQREAERAHADGRNAEAAEAKARAFRLQQKLAAAADADRARVEAEHAAERDDTAQLREALEREQSGAAVDSAAAERERLLVDRDQLRTELARVEAALKRLSSE